MSTASVPKQAEAGKLKLAVRWCGGLADSIVLNLSPLAGNLGFPASGVLLSHWWAVCATRDFRLPISDSTQSSVSVDCPVFHRYPKDIHCEGVTSCRAAFKPIKSLFVTAV